MLILGIDTSCDDTSAAVVDSGSTILTNIVSSQDEIHTKYGGIVPELASRRHMEMVWPVVSEALEGADARISDIAAIAVTHGPGLIGSLLVGVCFAKSLSFVHAVPLVPVNHLEGHLLSVFLEEHPEFPFLALVVSGGHTSMYEVIDFTRYREISRTRDDAAGEAYDKVAKLLGFGYPGGPAIDRLAREGDPRSIAFPRASMKDSLDFSFSGLKTAVLYYLRKNQDARKADVAASFQDAVIDVLTERAVTAAKRSGIQRIVLSGGVAANSRLRKELHNRASGAGLDVFLPSLPLCTDNAAMIAGAGFHQFTRGVTADLSLNPKAHIPLGQPDG